MKNRLKPYAQLCLCGLVIFLLNVSFTAAGEENNIPNGNKKDDTSSDTQTRVSPHTSQRAQITGRPLPDSKKFITQIMRKLDDLYRGDQSQSTMTIKVKTAHYTRTMKMDSWSLGKHYSLLRILKPKKERGTATLKAKDNLYIYLKKTDRTIKVSSSMMGNPWMGSHFTNDDLVRHTRFSRDFDVTQNTSQNPNHYVFTLVPKPQTPVVWGKIKITILKDSLLPVEQLFYDEDGNKSRIQKFGDFKRVGDRGIPHKMVMAPLGEDEGEYTEVVIESINFNVKLHPGFFSIHKLRSL